eukprot:1672062-Alexandrium_andersonii.AAC.1
MCIRDSRSTLHPGILAKPPKKQETGRDRPQSSARAADKTRQSRAGLNWGPCGSWPCALTT